MCAAWLHGSAGSRLKTYREAESFEKFVAGKVAGQKLSKEAISKIEGIDSTAGKIVAGAAETE